MVPRRSSGVLSGLSGGSFGLGRTPSRLGRLHSLGGWFPALGDSLSPLSLKGRLLLGARGRFCQLLSSHCHGLYALLERKILGRILQMGDHWFCLPIKEAIAEKGGRSEGNFLLLGDARIHGFQDVVSTLEGGSSHEVNQVSRYDHIEVPERPDHSLGRGEEGGGGGRGLF